MTVAPARTRLTPAHARLLLDPRAHTGAAVVRAALLHLAALGRLRTERVTGASRFFSMTSLRIVRGEGDDPLPPHLRALLDALFPPGAPTEPLAPATAVHRLQKAFGYGYGRYVSSEIRPALVERGLVEEEEYRMLGLFPRRRWKLTGRGERARAALDARLRAASEIPSLLRREPERAAAVAASLGGLVLAADVLRPHYAALGEALRAHGAAFSPAPDPLGVAEEEEERRTAWMDVMEALTQVDWPDVLDAVGDLSAAFDAGGGDAGGGEGGDGGGGGE